jgi:hypothetical protein
MTKDEYGAQYLANARVEGFGATTTQVMPCPFCCEPDFMRVRIMHAETDMQKGGICKKCGRGSRAIFTRSGQGTTFEFVQTCGDAPPDYVPQMRRVDVQ